MTADASTVRANGRLLGPGDADPVLRIGATSNSPWLLLCDHAANRVPQRLDLGIAADALADHIGIDIGAWALTGIVAKHLRAEAIGQAYSRLVIDCNRQPGTPGSIPKVSDGRAVPGNAGATDAAERVAEIFEPYHRAIDAAIAARPAPPMVAAMHSFTRALSGQGRRTTDIGIIHGPRSRLADAVLAALAGCGLQVDRNAPYQIDFAGDYTLPVHAEPRGLDYVEIEVCQDLIGDAQGQQRLGNMLATAFAAAQSSLS